MQRRTRQILSSPRALVLRLQSTEKATRREQIKETWTHQRGHLEDVGTQMLQRRAAREGRRRQGTASKGETHAELVPLSAQTARGPVGQLVFDVGIGP